MKTFILNLSLLVFLISVFGLVSCGSKSGVSLDRSKYKADMSSCTALLKKKKHEKAIKCFEAYKSRHAGQPGAAAADLAVADAYFDKKDYLLAGEAYQIFVENNPYSSKVAYAYYKAGLSYLKESPKAIDRDQTYLDHSIKLLGSVLKYYANSSYAKMARTYYDEARRRLAKRHYYVGRFYYKSKEYLAAIPRFQVIVTDFPKLGLDEQSFYYLIQSLKKVKQKDLASKYLEVFRDNYPDSSYVKRVGKI